MSAIDFPNSPSVNDTYTDAGTTWIWNGTTWKVERQPLQGPSGFAAQTSAPDISQLWLDTDEPATPTLSPNVVDAKGDLLVGDAADTVVRLPVGTNGTVLTANSSATNGIEWASPKTWTQVATGSLTGASVSITGLNAGSKAEKIFVMLEDWSHNDTTGNRNVLVQVNSNTGGIYFRGGTGTAGDSSLILTGGLANASSATSGFHIDFTNTSFPYKAVTIAGYTGTSITGGFIETTSEITSIQLLLTGGSFDNGTYYVWEYR
jgi:hypothetical protein